MLQLLALLRKSNWTLDASFRLVKLEALHLSQTLNTPMTPSQGLKSEEASGLAVRTEKAKPG